MDVNLQHEDLLIKLRAKLNEDKIKLWEPPYLVPDAEISQSLQDLGRKYATVFTVNDDTVISALRELQLHSIDRSKANAQFKETGFATLRVRATVPGEKPKNFKVEKKLDVMGSDLITSVANEIEIDEGRLKLIYNGKVIKQTPSLDAQGIRNGAQIMALVMAESVEESKREDRMYMEMKSTMDDAALLSEYVDDLGQDDYMRLEDQSGKTVELPTEERRSLMIGLTLHERGRAAVRQKDYTLALVLFLEADRQLSECRSSLLKSVDNWAVLQLDISWCYLCLQNLSNCADAALRLDRAQNAFRETYGDRQQRLIALKGTAANERVLFMRLYLLQGIVAYHQNKRSEARSFLENAEQELNALRVDDNAVVTLIQLGWTAKQAREGLRAAHGDINSANNILTQRSRDRDKHRTERQQRLLGTCLDGNPINRQLLDRLMERGHSYKVSAMAARDANNNEAVAVALLTEHGHLYADSEESSGEVESSGSDGSHVEPDNKLVAELEAMGYCTEDAKTALKVSKNNLHEAIDVLVAGSLNTVPDSNNTENPSTSRGTEISPQRKRSKKDKKKREREQALRRLKSSIKADEDDYLDSQLADEELFLTQYKSLL